MKALPYDSASFSWTPGVTLIEASAGTGKTHSITQLVEHWLAGNSVAELESMLVLTFTNAAANELRTRIRAHLAKALDNAALRYDATATLNLGRALASFDRASIHTIHGFCQRILHEFPLECGLPVEFELMRDDTDLRVEQRTAILRRIHAEAANHPCILSLCQWMPWIEWLKTFLSNRNLLQIAEAGSQEDLIDPWEPIETALERTRQDWLQDRMALRELLLDPKNTPLRREKGYKVEDLTPFFDALDRWALEGKWPLDLLKILELLSPGKLTALLKKKKTLPESVFLTRCNAFADHASVAWEQLIAWTTRITTSTARRLISARHQVRYDDLLRCLAEGLRKHPSLVRQLRSRFHAGLIDEFQDTDPLQFEILTRIFVTPIPGCEDVSPRPLILIGDPKQAIYSFRGGDIFTYRRATLLAHTQLYLNTNWRSVPALNEGVNRLLLDSPDPPFGFSWLGYEPVRSAEKNQDKVLVSRVPGEEQSSRYLDLSGVCFREVLTEEGGASKANLARVAAWDIAKMLDGSCLKASIATGESQALNPGDIAVLFKSNAEGELVRKALAKLGIPALIHGGASIFATDQAQDWRVILSAIQQSQDVGKLKSALATAPFGLSARELLDLASDEQRWQGVSLQFAEASRQWQQGQLPSALSALDALFDWQKNLASGEEPMRALTNHAHLLDLILEANAQDCRAPQVLLSWLDNRIAEPDPNGDQELLRLDRQSHAVHLLTIHKSKGLQYPVVLVPFSLDEPESSPEKELPFGYHDEQGVMYVAWTKQDLTDDATAAKLRERASETQRMLYVAITRAVYHCRLYFSEKSKKTPILKRWLPEGLALHDGFHPAKLDRMVELPGIVVLQGDSTESGTTSEKTSTLALPPSGMTPLTPPPASPIPAPSPSRWSFSAIVQHDAEAWEPGTDEWMIVPEETGKKTAGVSTVDFHHFPKGIQAGLCLHELLEIVDFSEPATWPGAVRSALTTFGWEPEQWESILLRMLEQVADLPIPVRGSPLRLANLESGQLFREVEFSLPVAFDAVQYETVRRSFAAWTATQPFGAATLPAVRMAERLVPGMMQGVIDLWFLWEDQVHLLDWKSNWLGEDNEAYYPASLARSMQEHHYHLQYLLYLVALRRFLRRVRPGFDYQQQFGGVHYFFLRGLESGNPADSVFQACPPESLILELDQCFSS